MTKILEGPIHSVSEPRFNTRTANGARAEALYAASRLPAYQPSGLPHGVIHTANDSLFNQTHYSEPMTNYAVGWADEEGYDELTEFMAPSFPAPGELFEHLQFDNAEEFLSDGANDDLRAINASFATVDYTQSMVTRKVGNRGLRVELDWDRIKTDPIWQQRWTGRLLRRLKRNQARRAAALLLATGTSNARTWKSDGTGTQPDIDLNAQRILAQNNSGIKPNRILFGDTAWQYRLANYGASASLSAAAGLSRTPEQVGALLGMEVRLDTARYQNGASKSEIIGANVALFNGLPGVDADDPTNLKIAWVTCQNGMRYAVYVRQISVKKWEIVVEHYEALFAATVLGVYILPIAQS